METEGSSEGTTGIREGLRSTQRGPVGNPTGPRVKRRITKPKAYSKAKGSVAKGKLQRDLEGGESELLEKEQTTSGSTDSSSRKRKRQEAQEGEEEQQGRRRPQPKLQMKARAKAIIKRAMGEQGILTTQQKKELISVMQLI